MIGSARKEKEFMLHIYVRIVNRCLTFKQLRCQTRVCLLFRILEWRLKNLFSYFQKHIFIGAELQVAVSKTSLYSTSLNPRWYYGNFRYETYHSSNLNAFSNLDQISPGSAEEFCVSHWPSPNLTKTRVTKQNGSPGFIILVTLAQGLILLNFNLTPTSLDPERVNYWGNVDISLFPPA